MKRPVTEGLPGTATGAAPAQFLRIFSRFRPTGHYFMLGDKRDAQRQPLLGLHSCRARPGRPVFAICYAKTALSGFQYLRRTGR